MKTTTLPTQASRPIAIAQMSAIAVEETKWMRVDDLRYSQRGIGSQFQDGHTFEELVNGLDAWIIDRSVVLSFFR